MRETVKYYVANLKNCLKKEWDALQSGAISLAKVERQNGGDKSEEIGNFPLENITWVWRNPNPILRTGKILWR